MAAPQLSGLDPVTFSENTVNSEPQLLDADVSFSDLDGNVFGEGHFDGGTLTVTGLLAEDIVSILHQGAGLGELGFVAGFVSYSSTPFGTVTGGSGGTPLTVTFGAQATSEAIDALIQHLTYANVSDTPTASRTLTITVTDGAGNVTHDVANPAFVQQGGAANPFNGVDVGNGSAVAFADLDADGDLDALVGESLGGTLQYFKNTGSVTAPVFVQQSGVDNPFNGLTGPLVAQVRPVFADLDDDGDQDAVVGNYEGKLFYFENTGTATAPVFEQQIDGDNPFNGFQVYYRASAALADIDGDGDFDAVVGDFNGALHYFENTGTASAPAYVQQTGSDNPFSGLANWGPYSTPALADIDGDGDLDAMVGTYQGAITFLRNTGTTTDPVFVEVTGAGNPLPGVDATHPGPVFADLNGDGFIDVVVGTGGGGLSTFLNAPPAGMPITVNVTAENDAPTAVVLTNTTASLAENTSTATRIKVADIVVTDVDATGGNLLAVVGDDAALFEIDGSELFLKAGTALNFESQSAYSVAVTVDDIAVGDTPDATSTTYVLTVTDVPEPPTAIALTNTTASLAENVSTATRIKVADIVVTDDEDTAANRLYIVGADAAAFEIDGLELFLKAGTFLDFETKPSYSVGVIVDELFVGASPDATSALHTLTLTNVVEPPDVSVSGNGFNVADGDTTPRGTDGTAFGPQTVGTLFEQTFTVTNHGDANLTTSGLKLPKGFKLAAGESLAATILPGQSDTFKVVLDTSKVGSYGGVITFKTNDADEATFDFAISATVVAPEIDVKGNNVNILDNDKTPGSADNTDFLSQEFGTVGLTRTFTVNNSGAGDLNIASLVLPTGFVLVEGLSSTIAAGASDTFEVQLNTAVTGAFKGYILITSNDSNEALFNFTIQGNVTAEIRNGDPTDNTFVAQAHAESFFGGDGTDTVNYSGTGSPLVASLLAPAKNTGFAAGDTYNAIENLIGCFGNDTLTGNAANNVLEGGAGADKLDGGAGIDTASYAGGGPVTASLLKPKENSGNAAGDTYKNIENLLGSAFNDTLTGDAKVNAITGGDGDDTLAGNGGVDTLTGGLGADTFLFNAIKDGGGAIKVLGVTPAPTGDIITDFVSGEDHIGILRSGFKLALTLDEAAFQASDYFVSTAGAAPTTINETGVAATTNLHGQFLFNETTDQLWWDADGSGANKAVLLATFVNAQIAASDFDLLV